LHWPGVAVLKAGRRGSFSACRMAIVTIDEATTLLVETRSGNVVYKRDKHFRVIFTAFQYIKS